MESKNQQDPGQHGKNLFPVLCLFLFQWPKVEKHSSPSFTIFTKFEVLGLAKTKNNHPKSRSCLGNKNVESYPVKEKPGAARDFFFPHLSGEGC